MGRSALNLAVDGCTMQLLAKDDMKGQCTSCVLDMGWCLFGLNRLVCWFGPSQHITAGNGDDDASRTFRNSIPVPTVTSGLILGS